MERTFNLLKVLSFLMVIFFLYLSIIKKCETLGTEVPRILAWNILKDKFKEKILDNCQAICYNKFANNGYIISKKEGERHHDGKKIFFYYYSDI